MSSPLGIDLEVLDQAVERLNTALELVTTIRDAAGLLDELVNDPNDPVAPALEAAARMNGNGASPPDAPAAELEAGAGSSSPAPASSSTVAPPAPAAAPPKDKDEVTAPAPRRPRGQAVDAVLDYFEAHPREWLSIGDLMRALGMANSTAYRAISELVKTETIGSNGLRTTGRKYRLDPGLADELERPDDEVLVENGRGPELDVSRPELRRELERVAGLAPPLRSSAPPARLGLQAAANAARGPQGAGRLELKDRIRRHLLEEASTISELALALDVPRRDVAPVVLELEADDTEPVVKVPGAVRGRGETIYSNVA